MSQQNEKFTVYELLEVLKKMKKTFGEKDVKDIEILVNFNDSKYAYPIDDLELRLGRRKCGLIFYVGKGELK